MGDASFFSRPAFDWQRRYEALRALFVERLPPRIVADRFGYKYGYLRLLKHYFVHGKLDFSEPVAQDKAARRGVTTAVRQRIKEWRQQRLSAGEIAQLLSEQGVELHVRTVERVLAEEGFSRLSRRARLRLGLTVKGAQVPAAAEAVDLREMGKRRFESAAAGIYLFAPFIAQLGLRQVVDKAGLPGTKAISAWSYFLSFLSLKLLGTERYAHAGDHGFDPGLGLFAGLTTLPKCTAMSTYSYSLDAIHLERLQRAFVQQAAALSLYDGRIINLDFHAVPHFGEESVLERHWAGARGRKMKAALTLFAQDAQTKLMLYTDGDILQNEADDQVLAFLSFWRKVRRGVKPTLVFDSRFTTYSRLSRMNAQGVKFITLRRRGARLLETVETLSPWTRIHVPHAKRKFPNPSVHESQVDLRGYEGSLRQLIVRGNGHEKPAFVITNDFKSPLEMIVGNYARRWRVENGIAEAVKFFHLNALSSPILTKVHFDLVLTMIADTLYSMLARRLRGFEDCNADKLYRHFVRGRGTVAVTLGTTTVTFPRKAHNPILRRIDWEQLPPAVPGLDDSRLALRFK